MLKSDDLLHIDTFGDPGHQPLVFLHGFLGSGDDWAHVIQILSESYYCVTLDLPGHGNSFNIGTSCLDESVLLVENTLHSYAINNYVFVGYSMGARLIAYGAANNLFTSMHGFVLEGANLGGLNKKSQRERLESDSRWAQRFATQPLRDVLRDWYQQEVFASLGPTLREALINRRCDINHRALNGNKALGNMLLASSLAKQEDLREKIARLDIPKCYVVGENDKKFCRLSAEYKIPLKIIPHAGHNSHVENPSEFVQALETFIYLFKS